MQKRARVIYNPTSGREVLKQSMIDILNILEEAGFEASAYATTPEPKSAENEARRAAKAGFDLVVAAGGDGTINEVVNGIADLHFRPMMAIIPAGTTNDYARALKIPREDPVAAAKVVLKDQRIKMDIGKAGENYFINIAAGGLLTELTYDVPSNMKSIFGYLAYLVKGAELLPQIKPVDMDIEYDGEHFNGKASMFFLALTNSIGGFEQIVPDASLDDGRFTLIIVKASNLVSILHLMVKALNGNHMNDPRIIYRKPKRVKVNPVNDRVMVNIDGEYGGDAPMVFKNLHKHIEMFANLDKIPDDAYDLSEPKVTKAEENFIKQVKKLPEDDTEETDQDKK
ncbi:diacylglycerol kinase [Pediococcus inopinatus]|uniref:diacylglycerol kinase n=1 Tax=Pediococcus inopinatus TaxID=114090 RepID=UPI002B2609F4|nr:diacylglycerol kinase [Pediococcus inopinatus]WPC18747.1 diacylglycerol kinase [Pediococcus inopinatus]